VYILFNADWDDAVGNVLDQRRQPRERVQPGSGCARYLEYLARSLASFVRHHPGSRTDVRVALVEVAPAGLSARALRAVVAERVPGIELGTTLIPHREVLPFLAEGRAMPETVYRSPNRLHEAVLLRLLRDAPERYVAFVDPDVTFVADAAVDRGFEALVDAPHAWVAGFLERPVRRWSPSGWYEGRERLHSVAVHFDARAMRQHFPLDRFVGPSSLEERLAALRSPAALEHFRTYRSLDTLSLVTEYLRANWLVDRIVDLGAKCDHYAEGPTLTIASDLLVHCKWLEPHADTALRQTLAMAGMPANGDGELGALLRETATRCGVGR
jgi:hypothetical protein